MADIKSKEARSYNMSQIRSKDTKPEELVRKYLFSKGFRYRKNDRRLPERRILCFQNIKQLYLSMGVFGMAIKDASILYGPKIMLISGN